MNKPVRIYLGSNHGLPSLQQSLAALMTRIDQSGVPKDNLTIIDSSPSEFEYPALNRLWLDSHAEDFHGLYLHCKGASKTDEAQIENGLAWLNYMADGVLDNHHACRLHLERGADLVGGMWYRHFKGNFFWFRSTYVRTLAGPHGLNLGNRFSAEYWCSQAYWQNPGARRPKVKNLFYLPIDTDNDFGPLRRQGVKIDMQKLYVCEDLKSLEPGGNYAVYDRFFLTPEDYEKRGNLISVHSNYNSDFVIKS